MVTAATQTTDAHAVSKIAEQYYDSDDADQFYYRIWGGEDIHVGIYEDEHEPVRQASERTVLEMARRLGSVEPSTRVLDIGAGYGGAARKLVQRLGCHVTCLNLSQTQNARNREMTEDAGMAERIDVVHGNFEQVPFDADSFDVVWSQDAILHSGDRPRVLDEVARVLRPGGRLIFTDPMQADDCPSDVLGPVLARIHLDTLASFAFYREQLAARGFEEVEVVDLSPQLLRHYTRVREELVARRDELVRYASPPYVERMLAGLGHWIDAGSKGYLAWGILLFRLP
jgi:sarcosine/dimethylglycine N-methyltransferase